MKKESLQVTVFGGSKPQAGEPAYEQAQKLGRLLASSGYTVLTGGYIGTMEAVSRGAAEAGGHVIGVTCDEIEAWRPVKPNRWVDEEMRYPTLRERLYALIDSCDAAMALPGGIGTLAEVAVAWSQLQTHASEPRPLILIGEGWENIFATFYENLGEYVADPDRRWLQFAPDIDDAVAQLGRLGD
ncbi:MAG: Cytokinin riboside 5'-monophosphate phosphoribohydrolase [Chloroflexi bacterium]|nr:Cytokinin riboside 5'-monophosphate phosphoribohydrolase [Chloroflexota bacterium]